MQLKKLTLLNVALVAVAAAGGGLAYATVGTPKAASTTAATRLATVGLGTVMSSVSSSGNVTAPNDISVNFATSSKLTELDVTVGQKVKEGQVLARIDSTQAQAALDAAKAALASAQAKLSTLVDGPTDLVKQGIQISEQQAQQQINSAQTSLDNANQNLSLDTTQQAAAVAQAKQQLTDDQTKYTTDEDNLAAAVGKAKTQAAQQYTIDAAQYTADQYQQATDRSSLNTCTSAPPAGGCSSNQEAVDKDAVTIANDQAGLTADGAVGPAYATPTDYSTATAVVTAVNNEATTLAQDQAAIDKDNTAITTAENSQTAALAKDNQSVKNAQQQLSNAQLSLQSLQNSDAQKTAAPLASDVKTAQAAVEQAQAQVDTAQQTLDATALTAPADGTIADVNASVGQTVSAGTASGSSASGGGNSTSSSSSSGFITLTNLTNLQVVADIDEADSAKIKVGAPAVVTLNALPGKQFAAHVIEVADTATVSSNVVQYQITFALDNTDPTIKPGMTANVQVTTAKVDGVLNVTSAALHSAGATSYLMVMQPDGTLKRVDVVVGLKGDSATEISGAVKEGDRVALPASTVSRTSTTSTTNQRPGFGGIGGGAVFGGGGGRGGRGGGG